MQSGEQKIHETLNSYQANRLRISCQYIDRLLGDIESVLHANSSNAAFPRHLSDISLAQGRTIEDYVSRLRATLVRILHAQRIPAEKPSIPASRAIHVLLGTIDIAAEELKPKYMLGYGLVPGEVGTELNGIAGELIALVGRFDRYLTEGAGENFSARLENLAGRGNEFETLRRIEQIIRERGLVEFRPFVERILDRADDTNFEIAVFGRVSAGKSSLLNAALTTAVLPVGVTPVTAVPTQIEYSPEPYLTVWFSEAPRKRFELSDLAEFCTEQRNPGNMKRVVRIVASIPAARLKNGVAFVDTPGLGSLATSGAAETLAYLPKCDLGVVLVDAGSTLTTDDIQTIMALHQAAVPVSVLLSKADLLSAGDRIQAMNYVREKIQTETNLTIEIHPVSALPSSRGLLDNWFEAQIAPLYEHSKQLRRASLERKIEVLRRSVAYALEARLQRGFRLATNAVERARAAESLLRNATGRIEEARAACLCLADTGPASLPEAIDEAARDLLHAWKTGSYGVVVPGQLIRDSITQFVHRQVRKLQNALTDLAARLADDLCVSAGDVGLPNLVAKKEFVNLVRGTPVFELLPLTLVITRPRATTMFGNAFTRRRLAGKISRELRSAHRAAIESYWQSAREWSNRISNDLRHAFETYAGSYRAQAQQVLEQAEYSGEQLSAFEQSLVMLQEEGRGEAGKEEAPHGELVARCSGDALLVERA